jgi:hypothetical protein
MCAVEVKKFRKTLARCISFNGDKICVTNWSSGKMFARALSYKMCWVEGENEAEAWNFMN